MELTSEMAAELSRVNGTVVERSYSLYPHDGNITQAFGAKLKREGDANSVAEYAAEQVDL